MAITGLKALQQFVIREVLKDSPKGVMQTLPNKDLVNMNVQIIAEKLARNGIDPTTLKNANQVENAIKIIENRPKVQQGIKSTQTAKVFDLKGKQIKNTDNIMGGEELPPPGSRGGPDDIAAPVQSSEETIKNMVESELMKTDNPFSDLVKTTKKGPKTLQEREAEILARMNRENKEAAQRIRNRKMLDDAIDNVSPGFSGNLRTDADLVAEEMAKRMGKVYDDLPDLEGTRLYGEAYDALSKKRFKDKPDPEDMATGGRAGFKFGGPLKTLFDFLNENNPMQAYKKYLKSVENRMKAGKELEVAGEVVPIAAGGALVTNQMKKVLKKINEDQKKRIEQEAQEELRKDMKKADGGIMRLGFKDGTPNKKITLDVAGSKSGKQQIMNAPEGITADRESINAIINADIPISQKIDLLAKYQYGKGRTRIERDGQEIFMDEGGFKSRDIGLGFNKDGEGIGGTLMYNMETGKPEFNIGFRKTFKEGSGMTRRTFLKLLGGMAAIPIVGKFLKPFKTAKGVKKVPMIATDNVPGKPEWFDQLVNKVILEGDDVTKKFATAERQSIHQKTLDDGSVVRVTEDIDDGAVRVEYESEANVFGDDVLMEYKKPLPDEGAPRPAAEFTTAESGPVGRQTGPDDFDIDVDEVGGSSISDLDSDVSKLKEFATGQKPTMKEVVQNIKRKNKAKRITEDPEAQSDAVIRRQGEAIDYDDYASGGIARMLGE